MIRVNCPHCQRGLKVEDRFAGRTVNCPACKGPMVLPTAPTEPEFEVVEPAAPPPPPPRPVARVAPVKPRAVSDDEEDDRPRRRSRRDDEEDEDERPVRAKSRRADDDEDEEDRPRRKKKKKRKPASEESSGLGMLKGLGLILLGIVVTGFALFTVLSDASRKIYIGGFILGPLLILGGIGSMMGGGDDENEE